ncbi:MAG: ATP-binding cassette domain-containing protein [Ilumatobacteraceae bacterium]
MADVLTVRRLRVHFGGVCAVDGVDLTIARGELVGLIGPNGAGKTTLLDAIGGFVRADGRVVLDEVDLHPLRPHRRARLGLGRTWQATELFHDLSVRENIEVAARHGSASAVERALDRLRIGHLAERMPEQLSHAERKLTGIARAIAAAPRVVCMDEPAAGLDASSGVALGADLRSLTADGTAVLLVDHDMGLVLGTCDRVYVIEFGRVIAAGTPAEIRDDDRVLDAYLGHERAAQS